MSQQRQRYREYEYEYDYDKPRRPNQRDDLPRPRKSAPPPPRRRAQDTRKHNAQLPSVRPIRSVRTDRNDSVYNSYNRGVRDARHMNSRNERYADKRNERYDQHGSSRRKPAPRRQANPTAVFFLAVAFIVLVYGVGYALSSGKREERLRFKENAAKLVTPVAAPSTATPYPPATPIPTATAPPTPMPTPIPTPEPVIPTTPPFYEPLDNLGISAEETIPEQGFQELFIGAEDNAFEYEEVQVQVDESIDFTMLVNSKHRLADGYKPRDLVNMYEYCPKSVVKIKEKGIEGCREAVDALLQMFTRAYNDGVSDWQVSAGYRSIEYQARLFNDKVYEFQKENNLTKSSAVQAAMRYVAAPGASEHHTGLAFDITVPGKSFEGTPQCDWLAKNSWRYGFIVRYQPNKVKLTGISAEPWHIRYVGEDAAKIIYNNGWCLEEYHDANP